MEKAPDGQSEASLLSESSHFGMNVCIIEEIIIRVPEYLFPVASLCFSNTTKMVADDCRLQNMVGIYLQEHSSGKACDG